jgi:hypothetical protein
MVTNYRPKITNVCNYGRIKVAVEYYLSYIYFTLFSIECEVYRVTKQL